MVSFTRTKIISGFCCCSYSAVVPFNTKDSGQQPFSSNIGLGSVIKGWDEGVMTMQVGEVAHIQIMVG